MGFFDFFKQPNINEGIKAFNAASDAVLLDVRTLEEYREGHIPGSKNISLQQLDKIDSVVQDKDTALFVYCHSGARSSQATHLLQRKGYSKVTNIGGIVSYSGKVER